MKEILDWFDRNKRDLPWRNSNPWGVMVSEFMLQQTPVNRVLPIWQEWLERWPTPENLAQTSKSELLLAWGNLGYPRRALRLHESSRIIAQEFNNEVPQSLEDLRKLPGVGEYTANAILAFAFHQEVLVLDINIRRLFARLFDGRERPTSHMTKAERERGRALIPGGAPQWASATMDLGAMICTARNPRCGKCPVKNSCRWLELGSPKEQSLTKKVKWQGSDRQCRGRILQYLRENTQSSLSTLQSLWSEQSQFEKCLSNLIEEGFIELESDLFRLAR